MSQLGSDLQQNYQRFVEGVLASGKVWALKSGDEWVFCDSAEYHETDVIPFWSDRADAQAQCCDEWQGYTVEAIELGRFVEDWLTGMAEDGFLAGPNWNGQMEGLEVEPGDLAEQLLDH
jgi:hypothetical protein